jgi:hypothetical protein
MELPAFRLVDTAPSTLTIPTMSGALAAPPDAAADARWLAWKARGAESDRQSDRTMRWLFTLAIGGTFIWLAIQAIA